MFNINYILRLIYLTYSKYELPMTRFLFDFSIRTIELLTVFIMLMVLVLFVLGSHESRLVTQVLLEYSNSSRYIIIGLSLYLITTITIGFLFDNVVADMVGGTSMIISAIMLLVLGDIVTNSYPPVSFTMIFFPTFGVLVGISGIKKIYLLYNENINRR